MELIPKIKTTLTDNNINNLNNNIQFFNSPKNLKMDKNLEENVECYINPDPKKNSLTHFSPFSEFNTNQIKKSKRNSAKKNNNPFYSSANKGREENNINYNSNFSLSQNSSVVMQMQEETEKNFGTLSNNNFAIYDINELASNNLGATPADPMNFFPKKTFGFIYFEILNFSFSQKDYFKTIYPEMNLVMIMEINDCPMSQEKIFFTKFDEKTYIPILKKEDLQYQDDKKINRYRVIKSLEINDDYENYPIKISFNFYSFTNMRLLSLGSEDFFFTLDNDNKLNKFHLYQNIYLKYVSKKIGNLGFNYSFKTEEIYKKDLLMEMKNSLKVFTVKFYFF